jgi:hypothetical protein
VIQKILLAKLMDLKYDPYKRPILLTVIALKQLPMYKGSENRESEIREKL